MSARTVAIGVAFALGASALVNPQAQRRAQQKRLLVVSVTKGYRHASIPVIEQTLEELAKQSSAYTLDFARTDEELAQKMAPQALSAYDGVVFASTTGELPLPDREGFLEWLGRGHAFVGIHAATDTYHGWPAYVEMIGGEFKTHGPQTTVSLLAEDKKHPATKGLAGPLDVFDEIYEFKSFERARVSVLLYLDRHPQDHTPGFYPMAWTRTHGTGRVFYTALGHREDVLQAPWFHDHLLGGVLWALGLATDAAGSAPANPRIEALKQEALREVEARKDLVQQMVDMVFSFGELGFQEFETSKYLTGILRKEGFRIEEKVAGIPTAWVATWGTGQPVIALGTDIDCIPQASQKPGVAYRDPIVAGAPGHGEGHNSGQALIITAAVAVKKIMEREHMPGTIKIWPGVAEELLGTKAYFVRAGVFKDVDAVLYNHVGGNLGVSWGQGGGSGLVSVEYTFQGESAHAAGAPWRGRSALDAVELMDIGWNFKREHLRLQQRSHYVIVDGGDQPNVVPPTAAVWYYFRELDYPHIKELREQGDTMAKAAAMMTGTTVTSRVLGSAWPSHGNKTLAEVSYENIKRVGLPRWSEDDVALAKATQRMLGVPEIGLSTRISELRGRESIPASEQTGGPSDDIGDVMWNVPTVTLSFPSNFQAGPGHNWANAIAMATPIAHKGAVVGAKVQALNLIDLMTRPDLVQQAWDYFKNVQTKDVKYQPLMGPADQPAIWLNRETMEKHRPEMRKYYYDPSRYKSYLEQLGIKYPTVQSGQAQ